MIRVPRAVHFMNLALEHAKRSTCFRLNVGCLIASEKQIISLTHNGPPKGEHHCTGKLCPGALTSCTRSRHAEGNGIDQIILRTEGAGLPPKSAELFVTHSPCANCAWALIGTGWFHRIFYQTEFREAAAINQLAQSMQVYKITPAGYITSYPSGELIDPARLYP